MLPHSIGPHILTSTYHTGTILISKKEWRLQIQEGMALEIGDTSTSTYFAPWMLTLVPLEFFILTHPVFVIKINQEQLPRESDS